MPKLTKPLSVIIIGLSIFCYVNTPTPALADEAGCAAAKKVAQSFLKAESKGKRLYSNKEYPGIIVSYTNENGEKYADEPGYDSANIIDRPAKLGSCINEKNSYIFDVHYHIIGTQDANGFNALKPRFETKKLTIIPREGILKVDGTNLYSPYVTKKTAKHILETPIEKLEK
jgi:hypothetical protein